MDCEFKLIALDMRVYDDMVSKLSLIEELLDIVEVSPSALAEYYGVAYNTLFKDARRWMLPNYGDVKEETTRRKWPLRDVLEHLRIPEEERKRTAELLIEEQIAEYESAQ